MALIKNGNTVISFAEYQDVVDQDQRIFDANEGLTDDVVELALQRATERILTKMRMTSWWKNYYVSRDSSLSYNTAADIPALNANKIIDRMNDFKDLCVFTALSEYILPNVADFGNAESAERQKMGYYTNRAEALFGELVTAGDWYDFDGSGAIASTEKSPGQYNLKRVR
ncbi:hypothetical protein UFOVP758_30 [uncultured Caudovirales phage]|uniref:Uncharacterized protein n=1 Tax=uncultured Caudovirales phage TaxID=2100421 RepID=A0A6J7X8E6_9CAUD|nr:hypothetical protein UFOVP758_30 [uncultured Caudovirales phage]